MGDLEKNVNLNLSPSKYTLESKNDTLETEDEEVIGRSKEHCSDDKKLDKDNCFSLKMMRMSSM
jgi:hypothetical protein